MASPSWWGLLDEGSRQRLQAIITKMQKQGLLPCDHPTMMELWDAADSKLFAAILHNPHHVLHRVSCHLSANQHTICDSDPTIERSRSLKILFSKKLLSIEWY